MGDDPSGRHLPANPVGKPAGAVGILLSNLLHESVALVDRRRLGILLRVERHLERDARAAGEADGRHAPQRALAVVDGGRHVVRRREHRRRRAKAALEVRAVAEVGADDRDVRLAVDGPRLRRDLGDHRRGVVLERLDVGVLLAVGRHRDHRHLRHLGVGVGVVRLPRRRRLHVGDGGDRRRRARDRLGGDERADGDAVPKLAVEGGVGPRHRAHLGEVDEHLGVAVDGAARRVERAELHVGKIAEVHLVARKLLVVDTHLERHEHLAHLRRVERRRVAHQVVAEGARALELGLHFRLAKLAAVVVASGKVRAVDCHLGAARPRPRVGQDLGDRRRRAKDELDALLGKLLVVQRDCKRHPEGAVDGHHLVALLGNVLRRVALERTFVVAQPRVHDDRAPLARVAEAALVVVAGAQVVAVRDDVRVAARRPNRRHHRRE